MRNVGRSDSHANAATHPAQTASGPIRVHLDARPVTSGPAFHFFGYYDKFQVDTTGTRLLTMEVDFMDRMPTPRDVARIGVIDTAGDHALTILAETTAWCWQQSCMLRWFDASPDREIIYNTNQGDHYGCVIQDVDTGTRRSFDTPIYTVASDGAFALCPNFSRLATLRPGYGYEGVPDPWGDVNAPDDDGIYRLDFATGERRLIISLAQVAGMGMPAGAENCYHWFNHLLIGPDDSRFVFVHRWSEHKGAAGWTTRLVTANCDGSGIYVLNDHDRTSHFIWRDPRTVCAWAKRHDQGQHYYLFTDQSDEIRVVAPGTLTCDGHMSFRPQADWMVTDTYPLADRCRRLLLFNAETNAIVEVGAFFADPKSDGPSRCDLHPRWSRDGKTVTFDSLHEGHRQVYAMDVTPVVDGRNYAGRNRPC